ASEYSQAMSILKGQGTLLEAARRFVDSGAGEVIPVRTDSLVDDLLQARTANHASKRHLQDLRSRLKRFAKSFQCEVHTIRPAQVQDFLLSLELSPRSMNNFRVAISNLFSHAKLRGHVPKNFDPLTGIPWAKIVEAEVEIWTPDELKRLLDNARSEMVPYLAIAAFSGMRQAEIARLDWCEAKEDHIVVAAGNAKTRDKRLAPLPPNLAEWLREHRRDKGRVVPFENVTNQL